MDAKELMIGDWVEVLGNHPKNVRVKEILSDEINPEWDGMENCGGIKIKYVKPIPLTPEIFEKNGFKKVLDEDGTECYRYYNIAADGYIKISLCNGGDSDWGIEIVNYEKFDDNEIVYYNKFIFLKIHQLQHALKLCGIEKTIEL